MIELTVNADVKNLDAIFDFINQVISPYDCAISVQFLLEVAIEEIYVNIAHYAYPNAVGTTTIRCDVVEGEKPLLVVDILDQGKPYNPLSKEDPDVDLDLESREIGGLGIYMVKNSMDSVSYRYEENSNIFTFRKYLETE